MTTPLFVYDLTVPAGDIQEQFEIVKPTLFKDLNALAKKWTFQLEKGEETGYVHLQARISLHKKKRIHECIKLIHTHSPFWSKANVSMTSSKSKDDFYYCEKDDTRIVGPFSNNDKDIAEIVTPAYIPRQVREIKELYPWQKEVLEKCKDWDTRVLNCVYNKNGNNGKSTLISWARAYRLARCLPPVNDTKDLLRMVCDMPTATTYMFDMPRAMEKNKLGQFYTAVETIKDGYAYDDRYRFVEKIMDCPNIWIFTNTMPDTELLSSDRWVFWTITDDKQLERIKSDGDVVTPNVATESIITILNHPTADSLHLSN